MSVRWYANRNGVVEGPFDESAIVARLSAGDLRDAYVGREGGAEWAPIATHPPFAAAMGAVVAPPAPVAAAPSPTPQGRLDTFIRAQVEPRLRPGESLRGVGAVRRYPKYNALKNPVGNPQHFLAAATDQRLILLQTGSNGIGTGTPIAENRGAEVWEYADLREVQFQYFGGFLPAMAVSLVPKPGAGPHGGKIKRIDIPESVDGCQDQARLCRDYPRWLREQVMGPEHLIPKAPKPRGTLPIALGALMLVVAVITMGLAANYWNMARAADARAETSTAPASSVFGADAERPSARESRRRMQPYAGCGCVAFVLAGAGLGAGLCMRKRQRSDGAAVG